MSKNSASGVRLPATAKVSPRMKLPVLKHPEKVKAIANLVCKQSIAAYHRVGLIGKSVVFFDHDIKPEYAMHEFGAKPSRCCGVLSAFKHGIPSRAPKIMRDFVSEAYEVHKKRRIAKYTNTSKTPPVDRLLLTRLIRCKCKYKSFDQANNHIHVNFGWRQPAVYGMGRSRTYIPVITSSTTSGWTHDTRLSVYLRHGWTGAVYLKSAHIVDGFFVVDIIKRLPDEKESYCVKILVEDEYKAPGRSFEYSFDTKYSCIQLQNGRWVLGAQRSKIINTFIPSDNNG